MQYPASRYAIYFTPRPLSPLARFGAAVLGYDSAGKADVPHLGLVGIPPAQLASLTDAPRRYGFHATLVAPFYLDGHGEQALLEAFDDWCGQAGPAPLGELRVGMLGDFVALTPIATDPALDELARGCVEFFDAFRAPLSAEDLARRNGGRLSPRQRANLDRWGYPYVFEDFRFHMTLIGALPPADGERVCAALTDAYAPLAAHVYDVDALSLMRQSGPGSRFEVVARLVLLGNTSRADRRRR
jgi:putative phosphonate metabolism protein